MRDEAPSVFARLRAGLAAALARFAAGSHRLEEWTARHTRALLVSLVVGALLIAALLVGMVGLAREGRAVSRWMGDGPRAERSHAGPIGKPEARKLEGRHHEGRRHGGPDGRPVGKPHAPPPPPGRPAPPQPPVPPAPPAAVQP